MDTILEDQIRECFGRVVYTHKTHEKMADLCADTLRRFKVAQISLSALSAAGVLALFVIDSWGAKAATAFVTFLNLFIAGYMKGFDPGGTAQKHRDAAACLWDVRESYLSLLTDVRRKGIDADEAVRRRDQLQSLTAKIYQGSPQTNGEAYAAAQRALKSLEDYTFSDDEIDAFLPRALKKRGRDA